MRIGQGAVPSVDVTDRITRDVGWVADRWLRELRASRAYGGIGFQAASVGNYSHVQLFNPAASTATVILYRLVISSGALASSSIAVYNTALATNLTTIQNLVNGGVAAQAQINATANAALLGNRFFDADLPAAQVLNPDITWAMQLAAGQGVVVRLETVNILLSVSFFWVEI